MNRREYFDKVKRNKPIRNDDARFLEAVNGDTVLYSPTGSMSPTSSATTRPAKTPPFWACRPPWRISAISA